jgi:hypothetical protein
MSGEKGKSWRAQLKKKTEMSLRNGLLGHDIDHERNDFLAVPFLAGLSACSFFSGDTECSGSTAVDAEASDCCLER